MAASASTAKSAVNIIGLLDALDRVEIQMQMAAAIASVALDAIGAGKRSREDHLFAAIQEGLELHHLQVVQEGLQKLLSEAP